MALYVTLGQHRHPPAQHIKLTDMSYNFSFMFPAYRFGLGSYIAKAKEGAILVLKMLEV